MSSYFCDDIGFLFYALVARLLSLQFFPFPFFGIFGILFLFGSKNRFWVPCSPWLDACIFCPSGYSFFWNSRTTISTPGSSPTNACSTLNKTDCLNEHRPSLISPPFKTRRLRHVDFLK